MCNVKNVQLIGLSHGLRLVIKYLSSEMPIKDTSYSPVSASNTSSSSHVLRGGKVCGSISTISSVVGDRGGLAGPPPVPLARTFSSPTFFFAR